MHFIVEIESWKNARKGTTGYVFEEYVATRYYGFQNQRRALEAARETIAAEQELGRKAFAIVRSPDGSGVAVGGWLATCSVMDWDNAQFRAVTKEVLPAQEELEADSGGPTDAQGPNRGTENEPTK